MSQDQGENQKQQTLQNDSPTFLASGVQNTEIGAFARLRNYFFTGLIVAAPITITVYLTWSLIEWVDNTVKPFIPAIYNPDSYLPFSLPGVGILFFVICLTFLGFLTANFLGRTLLSYSEQLVGRMPLVRNIYTGLKQIFETVFAQRGQSFNKVALIEYPRKGLWCIVFISTKARGEVAKKLEEKAGELMAVFLPTTPNPTSGFLLFVPEKDIMVLDLSVEDAAKLIISAGLVIPKTKSEPTSKSRHQQDIKTDR